MIYPRNSSRRPVRNRVKKYIDASPETVFDYLAEPLNQPDWMDEVSSVDLSEDEPVEVGTRFKHTVDIPRRGAREMELEVTDLVENEVFEYAQIDGPYPLKTRYTLIPVDDGTELAAIEDSAPPGVYYLVMRPLVKWAVRRRLSGDLMDLKGRVEVLPEPVDEDEPVGLFKRLLRRLRP